MNKFYSSSCNNYKQVASKIKEIIRKIHKRTLLKQVDA